MKKVQLFPLGTRYCLVLPKGRIKAVPTLKLDTPLSLFPWGLDAGTTEVVI